MSDFELPAPALARSANGRFAEAWRTGQTLVNAGTLLGWNDDVAFHTPYANCTLVMPSLRKVRPGVTVVRLAREASAALRP